MKVSELILHLSLGTKGLFRQTINTEYNFLFSKILSLPIFIILNLFLLNSTVLAKEVSNSAIRFGLLPISSEYEDEGLNQFGNSIHANSFYNANGSVLFFTYQTKNGKTRLFGITASHVSQGKNLSINGQILDSQSMIGRLSQNDDDLEIFEFPYKSMESFAEWSHKNSVIILNQDIFYKWVEENKKIQNPFVEMTKNKGALRNNFVLKGDWINTKPISFSQSFLHLSQFNFGTVKSDFGSLYYLPIDNEVYAQATLSPGISGSPLLSVYKTKLLSQIQNKGVFSNEYSIGDIESNFEISVIGISKSASRHLSGSWFATSSAITDLLKAYLNGARGIIGNTRWRLRFGLTYRDFGNGIAEIHSTNYKIGNLTRGDGGNLTRIDNSNLTNKADSKTNLTNPFNIENWMKLNITPGIKYNHRSILGFRIFNNIGFYVEGNPKRVLDFFNLSNSDKTNLKLEGSISTLISEIPLHSDFISLLSNKFRGYSHQVRREDEENLSTLRKGEIPLNRSQFRALLNDSIQENVLLDEGNEKEKNAYISYWKTILAVKINTVHPNIDKLLDNNADSKFNITLTSTTINEFVDTSQSSITIKNNFIYFHIIGPKPNKEIINFVLDRNGREVSRSSTAFNDFFVPILSVKSNLGNTYTFDLRTLFFVDTTRYVSKSINPSFIQVDERSKFNLYDLLVALMEGVVLRFSLDGSQQVYEIQFNNIK